MAERFQLGYSADQHAVIAGPANGSSPIASSTRPASSRDAAARDLSIS